MSKKLIGILVLLMSYSVIGLANSINLNDPLVLEQIKNDKSLQEKLKQEYNGSISKNTSSNVVEIPKNISTINSSTEIQDNQTISDNTLEEQEEVITPEQKSKMNSYSPFIYENQLRLFEVLEENKVQLQYNKNLSRFGSDFFKKTSNEPLSFVSPPDDYMLSYGDSLKISIYGVENLSYEINIDQEGNLNLPKIGNIQLIGLNYNKARNVLEEKLKTIYPNSTILVALGNLRTMSVSIVGEVKTPGLFNVPALSKVKDVLIYANGINDLGSMRDIQIIRENKTIARFDLYALIKNGTSNGDIVLRTGDIVFVPTAKKLVSLDGNIKHPAIYETTEKETLLDLISFAGGVNSDSTKSVKIQRSKNGVKSFIEVPLTDKTLLYDGDKVFVGQLSNVVDNKVQLMGNIYRQESVEISMDDTVGTLIGKLINEYGLEKIFMPQTDMNYFVVKRVNPQTLAIEIFSGNLQEALSGNMDSDIKLRSRDKIFFFNQSMTEDIKYVTINGEVLRSGKLNYFSGMKLADALRAAGIKKESDLEKIKVISLDKNKQKEISFYSYEESKDVLLREYDDISVSNFFTTREHPIVTIQGAVNEPGEFPYGTNLKLQDVINFAKGLKHSARMDQFELISYSVQNNIRVPNINRISLQEAIDSNIDIKPYDEVYIQEIQGWDEKTTITLKGEVLFPGTYAITPGEKLSSVIKRAGGFTNNAFISGAVFTREDVKKIQQEALKRQLDELESAIVFQATKGQEAGKSSEDKAMLLKYMETIKAQAKDIEMVGRVAVNLNYDLSKLTNSHNDLVLKSGDSLYIPRFEDSISIIGEVMFQTAVTYRPDESIMSYVARAGGLKNSADKDNIFIIKANGEAVKIRSGYLSGFTSVKVERGDTVVVPFNVSQFSGIQYAKDITSILYQLAVSAAALKTVGAF